MSIMSPSTDILTVPYSEDAIAIQFSGRFSETWKYVAKWNQWLFFDGYCWREDDRLEVFNLGREMCREIAITANETKPKQANSRIVAGVLSFARADPMHAAGVDWWDRDPNILGCATSTVNLRTSEVAAPDPDDYITRRAAVDLGGDCPTWKAFLERVTGGNYDLQLYLQRAVGYCLTGLTSEHVIFFLYGLGANGKSVFVNTIAGLLGDYAVTAPMEMFVVSRHERHPTELARLRGARLVTATETETGQQWAEAKIKSLTGGDKIAARYMRQDYFEFTPQFKLMVAGNHKPSLRSVDEAIRRRIHLIPFTVTIPPEERDLDLTAKLKAEWPGILAWAIDGCTNWREMGLCPPKAVLDATDEYLSEQDTLAEFIKDYCETEQQHWARSRHLFAAWKAFATSHNEPIGTQKAFTQKLKALGFKTGHDRDGTKFLGIQPKPGMEQV